MLVLAMQFSRGAAGWAGGRCPCARAELEENGPIARGTQQGPDAGITAGDGAEGTPSKRNRGQRSLQMTIQETEVYDWLDPSRPN